jgi:hypothetical protein
MKKLFAALIFLLLLVGRADAAFYANYFTTNANPVAGSGGIVSNAVYVDIRASTRYTNSTPYYAAVSSAVGITIGSGATKNASWVFLVDTNLDGTYDYPQWQTLGVTATLPADTTFYSVTAGGLVPPYAAFRYEPATAGGATTSFTSSNSIITYFGTNSSSGGSGTPYTNNSGDAGFIVGSGIGTNVSAAQIAAIMGTNNVAGATNAPDGSRLASVNQMPEQSWKLNSQTQQKFYADVASLYWCAPDLNSVLIRVDTNGNYLLNENKTTDSIYSWLQYPFRPPVGSTQVLVTADFYSIFGTNTGFRFAYTTPSTAISVLETNFTVPASGPTNITLNYNTTTSDLGLLFWPNYSGSHSSSVLVSNLILSFLPAPTNAGLVGSWKRRDILPRYLNHDALNTTRYIYQQKLSARNFNACARLKFNTSATNFTVESVSESASWPFYVYTNGVFAKSFTPSVRASEYWDVTLTGNNNDVEIIYPISQNFPTTEVHIGSFVRGIFCAADAFLNFSKARPNRKFWVFGDSIQIWGRGEGGLWPRIERLIDVDYTLHAIGGSALTNMWVTDQTNFLRSFVAAKASDAYIAIGFNDYFGAYWGTNAFATNYGNMLDLMHQASPGTTIYAQAPIISTSESANALGLTLNDFRKVIFDAAQARSNFVVYIAGTNLVGSTSYLEDFAHPSELGFALYSKNLLPYFDSGPPSDFTQRGDRFLANNLGSITRTVFGPLANPASGLYFPAANVPGMAANGTDVCWWLGNDTYMSRNGFIFWASSLGGTVDTGLGNANAGEVEFNNGTTGVYRDVRLRTLTATNLVVVSASSVTVKVTSGSGSPESAVTAPVGSLYLRTDGGYTTTFYVKTNGSGNTGWGAK